MSEVRNVEMYATGLKKVVTLGGVENLFQSSYHLELKDKERWRTSSCFQGAMSLTSSAYSRWSTDVDVKKGKDLMLNLEGFHL